MNLYLIAILAILILGYLLEVSATILELKALDPQLPAPFADLHDKNEYARSQQYTRSSSGFSLVRESVFLVATLLFILAGGFNWLDLTARAAGFGPIITGILFIGLLLLLSSLLSLPFSLYSTFVIEERFGLNRTSLRTFCLDILRTLLLAVLLGAPLLAFILWFFEEGGSLAWFYCWLFVVTVTILMQYLAPVLIMPLFNTFTPLAQGELQATITTYAKQEKFAMRGIYTMDGSKRSTRLNAFFTGFGRFRRIVFFDTLIEKLNTSEIVAVLAHEMGHYKKRHVFRLMTASILQTGLLFFLLSLLLGNKGLFAAFAMDHLSVYASLVFFGFLYHPVSILLGIGFNWLSRRYEYEADEYAAASTGDPGSLISGLKKLSLANLSNLTPHPFNVLLHFSHPPVLQRISALDHHREEPGNH
ncbi:MAG: peptidase M48 [Deltaproteobacteria bacterium]|nr:MAG: peptidase M48 [Deltaproteobacteria bacterium]